MSSARTKPAPLTDPQLVILSKAAQRDDRRIMQPSRLSGAVFSQIIARLRTTGMIVEEASNDLHDGRAYVVSDAGLRLLGIELDNPGKENGSGLASRIAEEEHALSIAGASCASSQMSQVIIVRPGTKLAIVVELLARPGGVAMDELMLSTGWQAHTTRAALTGLRKRGIPITLCKRSKAASRYSIRSTPEDESSQEPVAACERASHPVSSDTVVAA